MNAIYHKNNAQAYIIQILILKPAHAGAKSLKLIAQTKVYQLLIQHHAVAFANDQKFTPSHLSRIGAKLLAHTAVASKKVIVMERLHTFMRKIARANATCHNKTAV